MHKIARGVNGGISEDEIDVLQRVDRVCIWCSIPRSGKRADSLARYITAQFRMGLSDETALFEDAMWREQMSPQRLLSVGCIANIPYRWPLFLCGCFATPDDRFRELALSSNGALREHSLGPVGPGHFFAQSR